MGRIALKFGYDGSSFYGYQRQPRVRTVEGDIIAACLKIHLFRDVEDACFASASRTDRGVHAIGNAVAFDSAMDAAGAIDGLNATCRDMLFHSYLEVPASFSPRRARMRHYRYMLFGKDDTETLDGALQLFAGENDFRNFSKSDSHGRFRSIDRIELHRSGDAVAIDFFGRSFLHNMVRRMVAAAVAVHDGKAEKADIARALDGNVPAGRSFGLAPPQYLVLMDVDYGMRFRHAALKEESLRRWQERLWSIRASESVFSSLLSAGGE